MKRLSYLLPVALLASAQAWAVSFDHIRIGDQDGFGYAPVNVNAKFSGADGLNPDRGGQSGLLDQGDLLPDLDGDGILATRQGDDFDNRSAETSSCLGCTGAISTTGSLFTDISLSTSYDASSSSGDVYDANTDTFGSGGAFPSPPSTTLSNQPGFEFDFFVSSADIAAGTTVFFNLIFGDYDVVPAELLFTRGDGSTFSSSLTTQPGNLDGLIQAAFAALDFSDVFTATTGGYDGFLGVDFVAPNEPYTTFDFVELSVRQIQLTIPEPTSVALVGLGLLGLRICRRQR